MQLYCAALAEVNSADKPSPFDDLDHGAAMHRACVEGIFTAAELLLSSDELEHVHTLIQAALREEELQEARDLVGARHESPPLFTRLHSAPHKRPAFPEVSVTRIWANHPDPSCMEKPRLSRSTTVMPNGNGHVERHTGVRSDHPGSDLARRPVSRRRSPQHGGRHA